MDRKERIRGGEWPGNEGRVGTGFDYAVKQSNTIVVTDVTRLGHGTEVIVSDGTGNWDH